MVGWCLQNFLHHDSRRVCTPGQAPLLLRKLLIVVTQQPRMVGSLLLPLGGVNVKVHPVVLLQVCDAYIRRNEKQERVIGTLLGSSIEGVVEVKSCYVVPHNESADQVGRGLLLESLSVAAAAAHGAHGSVSHTGGSGHRAPQNHV